MPLSFFVPWREDSPFTKAPAQPQTLCSSVSTFVLNSLPTDGRRGSWPDPGSSSLPPSLQERAPMEPRMPHTPEALSILLPLPSMHRARPRPMSRLQSHPRSTPILHRGSQIPEPGIGFCALVTVTAAHLPFCPQVHTEQPGVFSVHRFVHDCCSSPPTPPPPLPAGDPFVSIMSTRSLPKGETPSNL